MKRLVSIVVMIVAGLFFISPLSSAPTHREGVCFRGILGNRLAEQNIS